MRRSGFGWNGGVAGLSNRNLKILSLKMRRELENDVVEKTMLVHVHVVTAFLHLTAEDRFGLLGKQVSPNVHDFLDRQVAGVKAGWVVVPDFVRVGDVVDDHFEFVSTSVEFDKEIGLRVVIVTMAGELDFLEQAKSVGFGFGTKHD